MAILFNKESQQWIVLTTSHSFGRLKNTVNTFIPDPYISKMHTLIEWCGSHWHIKDISSNGTWLNNNKLNKAQATKLHVNDEITFANKSINDFTVISLNPPCDYLKPIGHKATPIELEHYHLMPSEEFPKAILNYNYQTESWWYETLSHAPTDGNEHLELSHDATIQIDDLTWQLQINPVAEGTEQLRPNINSLEELYFLFQTSLDEESTQIFIRNSGVNVNLKIRNHHYLTLILARHRVEDIKLDIDKSEQGWVCTDILAKELGLEYNHLNIQIHRIRKQFTDSLNNSCDTNDIIERKAGKLRFGPSHFRIQKAQHIEFDTENCHN